jgi:hypothetical protein
MLRSLQLTVLAISGHVAIAQDQAGQVSGILANSTTDT